MSNHLSTKLSGGFLTNDMHDNPKIQSHYATSTLRNNIHIGSMRVVLMRKPWSVH